MLSMAVISPRTLSSFYCSLFFSISKYESNLACFWVCGCAFVDAMTFHQAVEIIGLPPTPCMLLLNSQQVFDVTWSLHLFVTQCLLWHELVCPT